MKNAQKRNPSLVIARKFCRKHWTHRHKWRIKRWEKSERLKIIWFVSKVDFISIPKQQYYFKAKNAHRLTGTNKKIFKKMTPMKF